jgi:hypothetical protein
VPLRRRPVGMPYNDWQFKEDAGSARVVYGVHG